MIPLTDESWQCLSWQELIIKSISSAEQLCQSLKLPYKAEYSNFPVKVTLPYLQRMETGNNKDPLLLQVLSTHAETLEIPGYTDQPLEEADYSPTSGLIQKYKARVLVVMTGACAIHCRYCFRRNFPYQDFQPDTHQWQTILRHIEGDTSIREVILSGGDPLVSSDKRLSWIVQQLGKIEHLTTLRIHSRLPMVLPNRVCPAMLDWIKTSRLKIVLVNHINHGNEIDDAVVEAMGKLNQAGVLLLNQSVLLRDINDQSSTLITLSEKLFAANILPYYLHLLDPVSGAAHFDVDQLKATKIVSELREHLPGYLVPRLVREIPGATSKTSIF